MIPATNEEDITILLPTVQAEFFCGSVKFTFLGLNFDQHKGPKHEHIPLQVWKPTFTLQFLEVAWKGMKAHSSGDEPGYKLW